MVNEAGPREHVLGDDRARQHRAELQAGDGDHRQERVAQRVLEHDRALARVMLSLVADDTELFKQFSDNDSFKKWLSDAVFRSTYGESA